MSEDTNSTRIWPRLRCLAADVADLADEVGDADDTGDRIRRPSD
jgi:hypothetical protein